MIILTIRTDQPESQIGLYDRQELRLFKWQAHRQLAETIHLKIDEALKDHHKTLQDIQGIVVFKGPGSFTGLRIGLTVANALADSLNIPIVAEQGSDWWKSGVRAIKAGQNEHIAVPEYGAPVHITLPKH